MIIRNLDVENDWEFGKSSQSYVKDLQALMVSLKTRIQSWKQDAFFALDEGIDWKNLMDKGQNSRLANAIKNTAYRTAGVLNVSDVLITVLNRTATISFYVDTIYGSNVQNKIEMSV